MLKNLKQRKEGFTIIEVMIVLLIAAVIMLIVFLAIPALNRNSRNTQYKSDASALLAASQEFMNNNNGTLPVAANNAAILALAKTKSITAMNVQTKGVAAITPAFDTATLDTGVKCGTVGTPTTTPVLASTRSMVLVYAVEDASGNVVAQCIDS